MNTTELSDNKERVFKRFAIINKSVSVIKSGRQTKPFQNH